MKDNNISKKDFKEMEFLSEEKIKELTFHELCLYLDSLNNIESIMEGEQI